MKRSFSRAGILRTIPWWQITALLCLFLKSYVFYSDLHLDGYEWIFALCTTGIVAALSGVVSLFSKKAGRIVFWSLFTLGSFVMAVDRVYYAYVTKLPSAVQLSMVGQLGDVSETILRLMGWRQLFSLFDLPLWFLYAVNGRKSALASPDGRKPPRQKKEQTCTFAFAAALCLICVLPGALVTSFLPRYMVNELFSYHVTDIVEAVHSQTATRIVDKEQYRYVAETEDELWAIAKGRNVFVIQVEAFQNFALHTSYNGQELTPFLNRMLTEDTIYFDHYYYQIGGGNTADAEFAVNNSLFAPENAAAYVQYTENDYHGLPWLLKDNGYSGAHVFHNYKGDFWNRRTAYPAQGFDSFTALEDFEEIDPFPMGISDKELFRQSMAQLTSYEEPFYAFYITVSSHHPYAIPLKDREIVLDPADEETLFGLYMQAVNYVDRALESFVDELKEAGLYDNSILVIYGDHYALTNTDARISEQMHDLLGRDYTIFDVFNVPCIIHIPGSGVTETIATAGGHMDLMPTLLHLLGIEKTVNVTFGQNLLTAQSGFVCEQTHVSIGSFITDELFFQKPHNNLLTNYRVYEAGTMRTLSPSDYMTLSEAAEKRIEDCAALMAENDLALP